GEDTRPFLFRPYQGLSSFGPAQRRFFFGRDALIDKLCERLRGLYERDSGLRFLAILGPSGSGKSSVACAGLVARLMQHPIPGPQPMRVALFKPGNHPMQALAAALRALPQEDTDSPVLVVVDQFEEIYTLCSASAERDAFVELLLHAARHPNR